MRDLHRFVYISMTSFAVVSSDFPLSTDTQEFLLRSVVEQGLLNCFVRFYNLVFMTDCRFFTHISLFNNLIIIM